MAKKAAATKAAPKKTKPAKKGAVDRQSIPPGATSTTPHHAAADPGGAPATEAELIVLALGREQADHLDHLEELQRDLESKRTAHLEAKHAVTNQQEKLNALVRQIRQVERTGRCDRQPTLFTKQEREEQVAKGKAIAATAAPSATTDTNVADHPINQIGIPIPWVETLEKKHRVKTIGDLQRKISEGQFTREKSKGFATAARSELLGKLDAYILKHTVIPAEAAKSSGPGSDADTVHLVTLSKKCQHEARIIVRKLADGKFKPGFAYSWEYGNRPDVYQNPDKAPAAFAIELEALIVGGNLLRETWTKAGDRSNLKELAIEELANWLAPHISKYEELLEDVDQPAPGEDDFGDGVDNGEAD